MLMMLISFACMIMYAFMVGFTEDDRMPWVCAFFMALNWFMSEALRYNGH